MNGGNAIPQTLVVDPDGRVVAHWRGYARERSGDRLRQAIDSALMNTVAVIPALSPYSWDLCSPHCGRPISSPQRKLWVCAVQEYPACERGRHNADRWV
jgi:hypothetical protein